MALLVLEITIISCHAAGRRALGASNAGVGAAVLGRGGVGGDRLSLCSRAGTSWSQRREKPEKMEIRKRTSANKQREKVASLPGRLPAVEPISSPVGYPAIISRE